jgi:hypothetical protein
VFVSILYWIPIIIHPSLFLVRNNDLEQFFWPMLYFIKNSIINLHHIPLWNPIFFSGTPLFPDPQSGILYPLNIILLLTPLDTGIILMGIVHTCLAGINAYLLGKNVWKFSKYSAVMVGILWMIAPKVAAFIEAGHLGLIASWAWIPLVLYSSVEISRGKRRWILLYVVSNYLLLTSHVIIWGIVLCCEASIALAMLIKREEKLKKLAVILIANVLMIMTCSIVLIPQALWTQQTSRGILLKNPDVYPKWNSKTELVIDSLWPAQKSIKTIETIDTEKWTPLGLSLSICTIFGFLSFNKKQKLLYGIFVVGIVLIFLNNLSPIYEFLLKFSPYKIARVSTRIFFILYLVNIGIGIKWIQSKNKTIQTIFIICMVTESIILSWVKLSSNPPQTKPEPSEKIYAKVTAANEGDMFRIYCTTRCVPQKTAAIKKFELLEGYGTLPQQNYYQESWQLTGSYWNYYTLSVPPFGIIEFEKSQPDPYELGKYSVKYVLSPYPLQDKRFEKIDNDKHYILYSNTSWLPFIQVKNGEVKIKQKTADSFRLETNFEEDTVVNIAQVYSPGWSGKTKNKESIVINEAGDARQSITIPQGEEEIQIKYEPPGMKIGIFFSLGGILFSGILSLYTQKDKHL